MRGVYDRTRLWAHDMEVTSSGQGSITGMIGVCGWIGLMWYPIVKTAYLHDLHTEGL